MCGPLEISARWKSVDKCCKSPVMSMIASDWGDDLAGPLRASHVMSAACDGWTLRGEASLSGLGSALLQDQGFRVQGVGANGGMSQLLVG